MKHYLLHKETLFSDHQALLSFLKAQKKNSTLGMLNSWVLTKVHICHKTQDRGANKVANALSHMRSLLYVLIIKIAAFDWIKEGYASCPNFAPIYTWLKEGMQVNSSYHLGMNSSYLVTIYVSLRLS